MKKRKLFFTVGVPVFIVIVVFVVFTIMMAPYRRAYEEVRNMAIKEIDLNRVSDGSYRGDFTYGNFTYEVEVMVKSRSIADIQILQNRSDSKHAIMAAVVIDRVIEAQSLQVDTVSRATTTSKAFLKAVETALEKGVEE